ncbi:family 16 glycosylhydrolase [Bacillus halotolerans]|uniref:family 16 glycosylhydrolase n=1 Tax=Bacillus halotolerans TaxID=260554 RepID=UPI00374E04D9
MRGNRFCSTYGYGLYEVRMKPAKNVGIVSSFFTYTGPTDGTPWDEIGYRIFRKDTQRFNLTIIQMVVGNHEKIVDLGFGCSQCQSYVCVRLAAKLY